MNLSVSSASQKIVKNLLEYNSLLRYLDAEHRDVLKKWTVVLGKLTVPVHGDDGADEFL